LYVFQTISTQPQVFFFFGLTLASVAAACPTKKTPPRLFVLASLGSCGLGVASPGIILYWERIDVDAVFNAISEDVVFC
jgi:hypothetical protein